ncbi:MAG: phosphopyruvate hydratase [Parcubacteria group bacterium]|jgi:enolase
MAKIKKIFAQEVLDSRANPTVKAFIYLDNGTVGSASAPSGASTGAYEAVELRDNDSRYLGQGVLGACENINKTIQKKLIGFEISDQKKIDAAMIELDGTDNKASLGANATLAVSLASARAASTAEGVPLYKYLAKSYGYRSFRKLPTAFFNIINGGKHSDSGLSIQEFQIVPLSFDSFSEKLRSASEIFHKLKELLSNPQFSVSVGDEGGFAPRMGGQIEALEYIREAITESGYKFGGEVALALDTAASNFYDSERDQYVLKPENTALDKERLIALYYEWKNKYQFFSIEDGLEENDFNGWSKLNEKLGKNTLIVGDDLLTTNTDRLKKALDFNACNAAIVKPNQIGTLTETVDFIKLCQANNIKCVVSHRSGETCDDFIADLAVATGAEYVKFGAPCRGERVAKYNRLLEIEKEL